MSGSSVRTHKFICCAMAGLASHHAPTTISAAVARTFQPKAGSRKHSQKALFPRFCSLLSLTESSQPHTRLRARAAQGSKGEVPVKPSVKDEEDVAYRYIDGRQFYLDELDVVSLLDGFAYLKPFDPSSYNAVAYIWYTQCNSGI